MKIFKITALILIAATVFVACSNKRHPGHVYMPDMNYSRAYEANMPNILKDSGINYIPVPVAGTVRRGDLFPYALPNDSTGYKASASVANPLGKLDSVSMLEAKRLYSINCAICHGVNMDAQGPLAGKVGGIANLKAGAFLALTEGTIFHVQTYGKGNMGSYAAQMDKKQRWMVAQYVKQQQAGTGATGGADSAQMSGTGAMTPVKAPPPPPEGAKSGADSASGR